MTILDGRFIATSNRIENNLRKWNQPPLVLCFPRPPARLSDWNISVSEMNPEPFLGDRPLQSLNPLLFRVAFARERPCICYGCICLTPDERAYERRVFKLARAWRRELERQSLAKAGQTAPA
jgi:hypothetical protein